MNRSGVLLHNPILSLLHGTEVDLNDLHNPLVRCQLGVGVRSWPLYEAPEHLDAAAARIVLNTPAEADVAWSFASTKRGRELLRENGRNYVTSEGNIYIADKEVCIWFELPNARAQLHAVDRHRKRWSKADLQVVFVLLAKPDSVKASQPKLADWAGVSQASTHRTLKALRATGDDYTRPEQWEIRRPLLIERWAEAYAIDLRPSLELNQYKGHWNLDDVQEPPPAFALSGSAAMVARKQVLAQAPILELYGPEDDLPLRKNYHLSRSSQGNVFLRKRFWTFDPFGPAPDLLVYADLLASSDPRDHEAADFIRKTL